MRTIVYIDGFNFYYGLRNKSRIDANWKSFYWIDFVKLSEQFLVNGETLSKVKYFTAPPLNRQKQSRQSALFKANSLLNEERFEVIRGKYYDKQISCKGCGISFSKPKEKRTDVNISVNMVGDSALGLVDKIILISADSDLVPPIEFIKKHYPNISIKIYFPPCNFSYDLKEIAKAKKITKLEDNSYRFKNSIMDEIIYNLDKSDNATIPEKWKK